MDMFTKKVGRICVSRHRETFVTHETHGFLRSYPLSSQILDKFRTTYHNGLVWMDNASLWFLKELFFSLTFFLLYFFTHTLLFKI
jgi:hypothetical protein